MPYHVPAGALWPLVGESVSSVVPYPLVFVVGCHQFNNILFKFYNVKGSFGNEANTRYLTETGFKGLAQLRSGTIAAVKGHEDITWDEHALIPKGRNPSGGSQR